MQLLKDIKALIQGLGIAGKHLGRHAITLQYPEEKWDMPECSRGIVVLLSDKKTGELNCTSCLLCEKACPSAAIRIVAPRDPETKKRDLQSFDIDFGLCCFCGLCEESCNFVAIKMAPMYELSTPNKSDLSWDMKKLQEMGRDVPYTPKPKKKKKPVVKKTEAKGDEKPVKKEATEEAPAPKPPEAVEMKTEAEKPTPTEADQPEGESDKTGDAGKEDKSS
ncbi:MAG: 4Fe-4S dicluster domain-containing protein [candidate division Zixibacteria bacterium]|nr:4Fe-4S dicluster domain-containing protein [candidate division Zixibacteria bacterium]